MSDMKTEEKISRTSVVSFFFYQGGNFSVALSRLKLFQDSRFLLSVNRFGRRDNRLNGTTLRVLEV